MTIIMTAVGAQDAEDDAIACHFVHLEGLPGVFAGCCRPTTFRSCVIVCFFNDFRVWRQNGLTSFWGGTPGAT